MSDVIIQSEVACPSRGETQPGNIACGELPRLGYLAIKPPASATFPVLPKTYKCGLNKQGDIIGTNARVPYPGEFPKYHDIPIFRHVEWSTHIDYGQGKQLVKKEPEIAEYFTVENDEGYQKWAEKLCKEKQKVEEKIIEVQKVPDSIRQHPGHYMPTLLQTTNETYGSHVDLLPKYPAVYPVPTSLPSIPMNLEVRVEKTNNTVHRYLTDHPFIFSKPSTTVTPAAQVKARNVKLLKGATSVARLSFDSRCVATVRKDTVGHREKGFTFPARTHTGLELDTADITGPSTLCSPCVHPVIYSMKVPGKAPHAMTHNRQQMCFPYTVKPPRPMVRSHPDMIDRRVVYEAIPLPRSLC